MDQIFDLRCANKTKPRIENRFLSAFLVNSWIFDPVIFALMTPNL